MKGDGVPAVRTVSRTRRAGGENIEVLVQADQVTVSGSYDFKYTLPVLERLL